MAKPNKPRSPKPTEILRFLLTSHYLADDFPNVITTGNFAAFCTQNYASLEPIEALLRRVTLYGRFSAPRTTTSRRLLALPHPTNQLALSLIITHHYDEIRAVIESSNITLYKTTFEPKQKRAFAGLDFKARGERESQILARCPVIMTADIANFFHTIYSHSLTWAVLGKENVKQIRESGDKGNQEKLKEHWSSLLDVAIQRGNSRETFGIPVGPDTSRIVAEILLSGIRNNEEFGKVVDDGLAYRLVDDFFIGFEDEEKARRCQDALRHWLWEYNLHLNESKTRIAQASTVFDSGWKYEIDNFPIQISSPAEQREAVRRLLEITLQYCNARQDAQPAAFLCRRLFSMQILVQNIPFILDCMLRLARDFTICLKFAAQFITQYRRVLGDASHKVVERWAQLLLATHASRSHDLEVSWALVICGVLGLQVDRSFIKLEACSPVVLALLGLLSDHKLFNENWDEWYSIPSGADGSITNGRYWLPYYEAVLRGWTANSKIVEEIKADPFFSRLLKAKVTFLDDSDFLGRAQPPPVDSRRRTSRIAVRMQAKAARAISSEAYD
jgi:hypothetical protein